MAQAGTTSLIEKMKAVAEKGKKAAGAAITAMAEVAESLEERETVERLRETQRQLSSDTFHLIVMGRFKNGKSTLLNALMGGTTHPVDLGGHKGPMVVDDLPATAVLTGVRYSQKPYVKAHNHDGSSISWPLKRYLRESVLDVDEEESQRRFGKIREFEMGFPAKLCEAGVTIYDSPGLDDVPMRTLITREATKRCDAAVVVYRSDVLMGQGELTESKELVADGVRVFTVVNLWNGRAVDDRLRGFIWNRYVRDHQGGPTWAGQDFATRDLYLVDANAARDGRYSGAEAMVTASGLAAFEQRLGEFLTRERQTVHLEKFVKQADNLAAGVADHIEQRQTAIHADQQSLREKHSGVQPRLDALRARPKRIPQMFKRCHRIAEPDLIASFSGMVDDLRAQLPSHLSGVPLPSGKSIFSSLQQQKLIQEACKVISDFVTERMNDWGNTTAPLLLQPLLEELGDEIETEIAKIGRDLEGIHLDLTGWQQQAGATSVVGPTERVLSAVASVFAGNALGAIAGGAGGWRGALGSAAGAIGAGVIMGILGVTSAIVFWPVALSATIILGLLGGNLGMEDRAKAKAFADADRQLADLPGQTLPVIRAELRSLLDRQENAVTEAVTALIDEEIHNIEEMVRINQQDQADRERELQRLTTTAVALATHRRELHEALTAALQG